MRAKMSHVLIPHQTQATKIEITYRLTRKVENLAVEESQGVEVVFRIHGDHEGLARKSIQENRSPNGQHSFPSAPETVRCCTQNMVSDGKR